MRPNRHIKGSVLIELALILPLAVSLILGAVHFGYLFYLYNGLEKSVRDGARYAAGRTYETPAAFSAVVQQVVIYGSLDSTTPMVSGLTFKNAANTDMVVVTTVFNATGTKLERIQVKIEGYRYSGVLSNVFGEIALKGKPSVDMPYLGRFVK